MTDLHTDAVPPWRRGWLYCAEGQRPTLVWIAVLHGAGLFALCMAPWRSPATAPIGWLIAVVGGFGTTLAFHRSLAHRAVALHPFIEQALIFFAVFNGSGSPITWVANHRHHHRHADSAEDVHSPQSGTFWWAHLRWLWQWSQAPPERYCPELLTERYQRWSRWQPAILLLALLAPLPLGWAAWAWLGPLRLLVALHAQLSVNSFGHLGPAVGRDHARNLVWLGPIQALIGENWHRNHHDEPGSARIGRAWWQIDIGWYFICALEWIGLAHHRQGSDHA